MPCYHHTSNIRLWTSFLTRIYKGSIWLNSERAQGTAQHDGLFFFIKERGMKGAGQRKHFALDFCVSLRIKEWPLPTKATLFTQLLIQFHTVRWNFELEWFFRLIVYVGSYTCRPTTKRKKKCIEFLPINSVGIYCNRSSFPITGKLSGGTKSASETFWREKFVPPSPCKQIHGAVVTM